METAPANDFGCPDTMSFPISRLTKNSPFDVSLAMLATRKSLAAPFFWPQLLEEGQTRIASGHQGIHGTFVFPPEVLQTTNTSKCLIDCC